MENEFTGVIVKESLSDLSILNEFETIKQETVGPADDTWTLITVKASAHSILGLKDFIKDGPWYAHFRKGNELVVVFKGKIVSNEKAAREYGLSIGIPQEQLDFKED